MKKLRKFKYSEEISARKKLKKAAIKRNQRKTLYPYGFEYKKESK